MSEEQPRKFEWNDELVLEFARFTNTESPTFQGRYADLDQFKQSKDQPLPERIKVHAIKKVNEKYDLGDPDYVFAVTKAIPENKFPAIKKAIEFVINSPQPSPVDKGNVLFTTEDGVEIREGDDFCYIDHYENWKINWLYKVNSAYGWFHPLDKTLKTFSTKEAAEQYIIDNKPCLSANDIKWWLEKYFNCPNGISVTQLKELVKEKLKQ